MSKAEKTKEFIIGRCAPIFNTKGYAGTSLSDIIEATGLTKGAVYGNFEDKEAVAVAVYQYSIAGLRKRQGEAMDDKKTATGKLLAFTGYYRSNWKGVFKRGGCPIQNASVEADDNLPFLKKHVQESIKSWAGNLEKIIEEGRAGGEFKKSVSAKKAAFDIITLVEGGIQLSKIMNDQGLLFSALDRIEALIEHELKK